MIGLLLNLHRWSKKPIKCHLHSSFKTKRVLSQHKEGTKKDNRGSNMKRWGRAWLVCAPLLNAALLTTPTARLSSSPLAIAACRTTCHHPTRRIKPATDTRQGFSMASPTTDLCHFHRQNKRFRLLYTKALANSEFPLAVLSSPSDCRWSHSTGKGAIEQQFKLKMFWTSKQLQSITLLVPLMVTQTVQRPSILNQKDNWRNFNLL